MGKGNLVKKTGYIKLQDGERVMRASSALGKGKKAKKKKKKKAGK